MQLRAPGLQHNQSGQAAVGSARHWQQHRLGRPPLPPGFESPRGQVTQSVQQRSPSKVNSSLRVPTILLTVTAMQPVSPVREGVRQDTEVADDQALVVHASVVVTAAVGLDIVGPKLSPLIVSDRPPLCAPLTRLHMLEAGAAHNARTRDRNGDLLEGEMDILTIEAQQRAEASDH